LGTDDPHIPHDMASAVRKGRPDDVAVEHQRAMDGALTRTPDDGIVVVERRPCTAE
jgi:hypothetical protein